MNNRESLFLCHMTAEEKKVYNAKYYQEHKDYWPEWREKHGYGSGRSRGSFEEGEFNEDVGSIMLLSADGKEYTHALTRALKDFVNEYKQLSIGGGTFDKEHATNLIKGITEYMANQTIYTSYALIRSHENEFSDFYNPAYTFKGSGDYNACRKASIKAVTDALKAELCSRNSGTEMSLKELEDAVTKAYDNQISAHAPIAKWTVGTGRKRASEYVSGNTLAQKPKEASVYRRGIGLEQQNRNRQATVDLNKRTKAIEQAKAAQQKAQAQKAAASSTSAANARYAAMYGSSASTPASYTISSSTSSTPLSKIGNAAVAAGKAIVKGISNFAAAWKLGWK